MSDSELLEQKPKYVEKIPFFEDSEDPTLYLCLDWEVDEQEEVQRSRHGFYKRDYLPPFFYAIPDFGVDLFEINVFDRKESETSICELWNHNECMFSFAVSSQMQMFNLIKQYISIVKDMCIIQKHLKQLHADEE